MIRAVCEYSRLILITVVIFSFGDAVALLRESYRLDRALYAPGARCIGLFLL